MKVKLVKKYNVYGHILMPDSVVSMPETVGQRLINEGIVTKVADDAPVNLIKYEDVRKQEILDRIKREAEENRKRHEEENAEHPEPVPVIDPVEPAEEEPASEKAESDIEPEEEENEEAAEEHGAVSDRKKGRKRRKKKGMAE